MYYQNDFFAYLQQLFQCYEDQQRQLDQLQSTIDELQNTIDTLKQSNENRPERIEYRFDQLKVERLEGTLNIGLSPNGGFDPNSIEDFSVSQNKPFVENTQGVNPFLFNDIKKAIHMYLNGECYTVLQNIEGHFDYPLDDTYRNFIIEDVRKQIDQRIQYYLKEVNIPINSSEIPNELRNETIDKVKVDINRTLEEFIKHLPMKGDQL